MNFIGKKNYLWPIFYLYLFVLFYFIFTLVYIIFYVISVINKMDVRKQQEEKFREACCYGDADAVMNLISKGVNVNSQHEINGWWVILIWILR